MFEFIITFSDMSVVYRYRDKEVTFVLDSINKRLRDDIVPDKVFLILNGYIKHKGDAFSKELYERLLDSKNATFLEASKKGLEPMPLHIVHNILDLFDFEDVKSYIANSGLIRIPSMLPDEYDLEMELDEKGSREQTYLKNDYLELVTLVTILKSTTGVIGNYASIKSNILAKNSYKELLLFSFYISHPIFKIAPFKKVYDSIVKLIDRLYSDRENTAIRIIERNINKDSYAAYITADTVIQKLLVNSELLDTDVRNTITKIYHYASNRIKLKDNGSKIKIKHFANGDTDGSDPEAVLESYRTPTELSEGDVVEFRDVFSDPYRLARELGADTNPDRINSMIKAFKKLEEPLPVEECKYIVSWLFKSVTDPRSFDYLLMDELIVALAVGSIYLWDNDYKDIVLLLSSFSSSVDDFKLNFSLRNKIHPSIREELVKVFPNNKALVGINGTTESSYIEDTIGTLSKQIMGYNLVSILPIGMLREANNGDREVKVNESIKNRLAEYILFLNNVDVSRIEY